MNLIICKGIKSGKFSIRNNDNELFWSFSNGWIKESDSVWETVNKKFAEKLMSEINESVPAETLVRQGVPQPAQIADYKASLLNRAKLCDLKKWAILFVIARLETNNWDWCEVTENNFEDIQIQIEEEFTKLRNDSNLSA